MARSLFVAPENFYDDELEDEPVNQGRLYDNETVYMAGDIPDDHIFEEQDATAILANWGQVRAYLHKKRLARGFIKQKPPAGGKKTFNRSAAPKRGQSFNKKTTTTKKFVKKSKFDKFKNTARPRRWTKGKLKRGTKCARCGQQGHWARECTNPPDARGARYTP